MLFPVGCLWLPLACLSGVLGSSDGAATLFRREGQLDPALPTSTTPPRPAVAEASRSAPAPHAPGDVLVQPRDGDRAFDQAEGVLDEWKKDGLRSAWRVIKAVSKSKASIQKILKHAESGEPFPCTDRRGTLPCKVEVFQLRNCRGKPDKTHTSYCQGDGEVVYGLNKKVMKWMSVRLTGFCSSLKVLTGASNPAATLGDEQLFTNWASELAPLRHWEHQDPPCRSGYVPDLFIGNRCITTVCQTFRYDFAHEGVKGVRVVSMKRGRCAHVTCPNTAVPNGLSTCGNSTCSAEDCCTPRRQCVSLLCPKGMTTKGELLYCKGDPCTQAECCE